MHDGTMGNGGSDPAKLPRTSCGTHMGAPTSGRAHRGGTRSSGLAAVQCCGRPREWSVLSRCRTFRPSWILIHRTGTDLRYIDLLLT